MIGVGDVHQTCLCGSVHFDRIEVERPDGSRYVTAFLGCRRCGVMYHSPRTTQPSTGLQRTGPMFIGHGPAPASVPTWSDEQQRELMDSVRRANRSKRKGMRSR